MPQRQQTQGDFGLRPTKVTQGITDVYHAPSIPKPDMSGLQAIANLSKTAMGLVQEQHRLDVRDAKFAQEEAEAHEKTGREFGEAHPFAEFPRGSTEAMILGGRKGRAAAMQSMYRNAVKEGFSSHLLTNPEEATNPDAFFNFADNTYNEWASTHAESLGELGLQEFAAGHIEWRHHQGAIHGNKAIAQGVEDFIGVSDTIMPQTLTELESINSAIDGYSDSQIIALFPEYDSEEEFNVEEHRQLLREQYGTVPMQNLQNYLGEAHRMGDDVLRQAVDRISTDLIKEMTDGMNPIAAHTMLLNLRTGSGAFIDRPEVNEKYRNSLQKFEANVNTLNADVIASNASLNFLDLDSDKNYTDSQVSSGLSGVAFNAKVEDDIYNMSLINDEDGNVQLSAKAVIAHLVDNPDLPKAPRTSETITTALSYLLDRNIEANPEVVSLGLELYRFAQKSTPLLKRLGLDAHQQLVLNFATMEAAKEDFQGVSSLPQLIRDANLYIDSDIRITAEEMREAFSEATTSGWWARLHGSSRRPIAFQSVEGIEPEQISGDFLQRAEAVYLNLAQQRGNSQLNKEQLMDKTIEQLETFGVVNVDGRPFQLPEGRGMQDVAEIEKIAKQKLLSEIQEDALTMREIQAEIGEMTPAEFNSKYPEAPPILEGSMFGLMRSALRPDIWFKARAEEIFFLRNNRSPLNITFDDYSDSSSWEDLPISLYSDFEFKENPDYLFINEDTGTVLDGVSSDIFNTREFSAMFEIAQVILTAEEARRMDAFIEHKDSTYFKSTPFN
jgi:hypothetical protein